MEQIRNSKELKAIAREQLLGNYGIAAAAYLIMQCIVSFSLNFVELQVGTQSLLYWAVYAMLVLLTAVLTVGQYWIYRKILRSSKPKISDMWNGFSHHPDKAILIQLLIIAMNLVFVLPMFFALLAYMLTKNAYLWLVIGLTGVFYFICAIFISLTFAQALYLLIDYPEESALQLLKHSAAMMKGHRFQLFYLNVSFLGIILLVVFTCGIGIFWAYPYMTCTKTLFYEELYAREPAGHINIKVRD